eukprot:TRINITY_DN23224_c0_g1_i1.p1 TRINITY_DN23224_c0_g1~~TRINITY_DN23224_c0_g1_i1.p1  ORF type:complete len:246 (-),score=33.59 TRINITY_DN23224_c0_g1_i1:84-752(-)
MFATMAIMMVQSSTLFTSFVGTSEQYVFNNLPYNKTVWGMLEELSLSQGPMGGFNFTYETSPQYGHFVTGFKGVEQNPSQGMFWLFYINGIESQVGVDNAVLQDGDSVQFQLCNPKIETVSISIRSLGSWYYFFLRVPWSGASSNSAFDMLLSAQHAYPGFNMVVNTSPSGEHDVTEICNVKDNFIQHQFLRIYVNGVLSQQDIDHTMVNASDALWWSLEQE